MSKAEADEQFDALFPAHQVSLGPLGEQPDCDEPLTSTAGGMPVARIEFAQPIPGPDPGDPRTWRPALEGAYPAGPQLPQGQVALGPYTRRLVFTEQIRAEGALAERERVRLELVAAATAWDAAPMLDTPGHALREFARRLEVADVG